MVVLAKYCGTPGVVVVTNEVSNSIEREQYSDSTPSLPEYALPSHFFALSRLMIVFARSWFDSYLPCVSISAYTNGSSASSPPDCSDIFLAQSLNRATPM